MRWRRPLVAAVLVASAAERQRRAPRTWREQIALNRVRNTRRDYVVALRASRGDRRLLWVAHGKGVVWRHAAAELRRERSYRR